MPTKSPIPASRTAASPEVAAPRDAAVDFGSNAARVRDGLMAVPDETVGSSRSAMAGDLDWMRGWLEAGPDTPKGIDAPRSGLPDLSGSLSKKFHDGAFSGGVAGSARAGDEGLSAGARAHGRVELGDASVQGSAGLRIGPDGRPKVDASASATASRDLGPVTAAVRADTSGSVTGTLGGSESAELWSDHEDFGHTHAKARAGGASLGARLSATRDLKSSRASARANAALTGVAGTVRGEHDIARGGDQVLGVEGELSGEVAARADATGSVEQDASGARVRGGLEAFAGAKAGAELSGVVRWERKDDYGPLIADALDNVPGELDDALLDRVPESVFTRIGELLFGSGDSELLRAGVGVDARAGAGAEAKADATAGSDGHFEVGASLGAAVGVGGGVKARFGANPLDLIRRGLAAGMGFTNDVVGGAEGVLRWLRGGMQGEPSR